MRLPGRAGRRRRPRSRPYASVRRSLRPCLAPPIAPRRRSLITLALNRLRWVYGHRRGSARDRLRNRGEARLHGGRRRRRRARASRRAAVHPRPLSGHVPRAAVDDQAVRRLCLGGGDERALPLPARPRPDRTLRGVRPSDAARARLRRRAGGRRGRPHRRRDRLSRRHGAAVRGHPARRGIHVDDDQRPRLAARAPLRARRREAGGHERSAAWHGPERHPQGVLRARELHLPAAAVDADHDRPVRVLPRAAAALEHDLDLGLPHPRGRARPPSRSSRSRSPTASPTARPRSTPVCLRTSSVRGSRSSSTRTTTSSRRSRSSGRRGGCGRGS